MTLINSAIIKKRFNEISKKCLFTVNKTKFCEELCSNKLPNSIIIDVNILIQEIIGFYSKKFDHKSTDNKPIMFNTFEMLDHCTYKNLNTNKTTSYLNGLMIFNHVLTYINDCFRLPGVDLVIVCHDIKGTNEAKYISYKKRYKDIMEMDIKEERKIFINDDFFPFGKWYDSFKLNQKLSKQFHYYFYQKFISSPFFVFNTNDPIKKKTFIYDTAIEESDLFNNDENKYFSIEKKFFVDEKERLLNKENTSLELIMINGLNIFENNINNDFIKKTSSFISEGESALIYYCNKNLDHNQILISTDGDLLYYCLNYISFALDKEKNLKDQKQKKEKKLNKFVLTDIFSSEKKNIKFSDFCGVEEYEKKKTNYSEISFKNSICILKDNIHFSSDEGTFWDMNVLYKDLNLYYFNNDKFIDNTTENELSLKNKDIVKLNVNNNYIEFESVLSYLGGNDFVKKILKGVGFDLFYQEFDENFYIYKKMIFFCESQFEFFSKNKIKYKFCVFDEKIFKTFLKAIYIRKFYNTAINKLKIKKNETNNEEKKKIFSLNEFQEIIDKKFKIIKKYFISSKSNKLISDDEIKRFIRNYEYIYCYFLNNNYSRIQNEDFRLSLSALSNSNSFSVWGYTKNFNEKKIDSMVNYCNTIMDF